MKNLRFILAAAFFAASGSLQAAGTIKTYAAEAAFETDDAVDWIGLGAAIRGQNALQLSGTFSGAVSASGSVVVSGSVATGNLRRTETASDSLRNSSSGERFLSTGPKSGPLTIDFAPGPVMGVGVEIKPNEAGAFTGRMNVYDAAGKLLGTATVTGKATASADYVAPFMGIRSSLKEIAKVEIDASSASGYTISGLKLHIHPIIDNSSFFVNQLYQDLFGRAPSAAELSDNLDALKQGATRAQVAASLFHSPEFHDNAAFLVKGYLALLQRDPDFVQWSQILKVMRSGATQDSALRALMNTPEFLGAYPDGMSDGAFINKLYRNLLGRDPESADLESWISKLGRGATRRDVVDLFLKSPEFEVRIASRVNTSLAYLAFLRRGAEPAGMNRWTEALKTGASVTDLIGGFISLPEYVARF
jgi:hypothetical protein